MKVQNKKGLGILSKLFVLAAAFVLIGQLSITANAQGTTTVTADSAKIRSSASTSSEVKASTTKNTKLDVLAQTQDSEGYTWYKVSVNGSDTGYIRADLVGKIEGSVPSESSQSQNTQTDNTPSTNDGQAVDFVQITDSTVTAAKVTGGSVNVRSNPSTKASVAGKATEGTEVTVSGEATDSDGKVWYQVSFGDTNGFIRYDFLEVTATVQEEETEEEVEEPVEEVVEEEPVKKEYELVFEANPEGVEEWFLYDYNRGSKQSLADLLAVVRQSQDDEASAVAKLKTYKIIVIVMIAVILALIVGVTLLVFKLKDAYEYEYEDDEDEDDEDEDEDDDDIEDDEDEDEDEDDEDIEDEPVVRKGNIRNKPSTPIRVKSVTTPKKQEPSSSWQSKNFLDVDDDMEFEFLDIK